MGVVCTIPRMRGEGLQWLKPWQLAGARAGVAGSVSIGLLARAVAELPAQRGTIGYRLQFAISEEGQCIIDLHINGSLRLRCECCLQLGRHELERNTRLVVVDGEDGAAALRQDREPVCLQDGRLCLRRLIEDDVLLSLPMVFAHERDACPARDLLRRYQAEPPRRTLAELARRQKKPCP